MMGKKKTKKKLKIMREKNKLKLVVSEKLNFELNMKEKQRKHQQKTEKMEHTVIQI